MLEQSVSRSVVFFMNTAAPATYTLSLHDALPISGLFSTSRPSSGSASIRNCSTWPDIMACAPSRDRKSTRLNSSHVAISYAVFCLKKKTGDAWLHRPRLAACDPLGWQHVLDLVRV